MEPSKQSIFKKPWVQSLTGILLIIIVASGILVYKSLSTHISVDNSVISAPIISISPESPGILNAVYVKAGDTVVAGQTLAQVGANTLMAKVDGIIINVNNTPGEVFQPGQSVMQMIDPTQYKVIGSIKETEGLSDIKVGDPVSFTVDAFPGKTYTGVVDSISPTSNDTGIAFSISDQRPVKEFDINVKYDINLHPEFLNGMSAKMKIYKK